MIISLKINGINYKLDSDPSTPLLWVIREQIGLTGTKFGCGIAQCGACTVHLNGIPIRSCITPLGSVIDQEITTIEGITPPATDVLHPVQQAWLEIQAPQCGYCQSGQIMAAVALLNENKNPNDDQINTAMKGNICRCGTYPRIKKGIKKAIQLIQANTNSSKDA